MNPLFNRIMIACDLSQMDEKLIKCAGNLSRNTSIEKIFFVHIISHTLSRFKEDIPIQTNGIYTLDEKIRFNLAEKVRKEIGAWSIDFEVVVRKGNTYLELLHFVRDNQIELVVLGQKNGKGGSGTMAKKLAKNVNSSVLFLTKSKYEALNSVLVPIDFTKSSAKALQKAIQIKKNMEQPVKVKGLHVVEIPHPSNYLSTVEHLSIQNEQLTKSEASYQTFITENEIDREDVDTAIISEEGEDISDTIYSDIIKEDAKLIVIGGEKQTAFERYFYGSVTERLEDKRADIPVLVVR